MTLKLVQYVRLSLAVVSVAGLLTIHLRGFHAKAQDRADARPKPNETRSYRFKARIQRNGGVTPFKEGKIITGSFQYDLKSKNEYPEARNHGAYKSARNTFSFQLGDLRFAGAGDIRVTVGAFEHAEHFQIVAFDLVLPKGWDMDHRNRSQTYGIVLQNAPPKQIIRSPEIPDRLSLADFTSTRELRLDFVGGVQFPGSNGKVVARVTANVESLEEVKDGK